MKKLLTSILSVLMALTIVTTVSADDTKVTVSVRYDLEDETSNNYGEYSVGETVYIGVMSKNGYKFTNWTCNVGSIEITTNEYHTSSFVVPQGLEDGTTIELVAHYEKAATVETDENTKVNGNYEDIVESVTEAAKEQGVTVDSTSTIKLVTDVNEATLTEEQAAAIAKAAEDNYWDIKSDDKYSVVASYEFSQVVLDAEGKTVANLTVDDYGDDGYVEVTVETAVPDSYFEAAPDGMTKFYWFVVSHDDGTTDAFSAYDVTSTGFKFFANKNSVGRLLVEFYKNQEENNNPTPAGPLDKNSDGIVDCVEENGKGWTWSQSKKACVYSVVNTSAK